MSRVPDLSRLNNIIRNRNFARKKLRIEDYVENKVYIVLEHLSDVGLPGNSSKVICACLSYDEAQRHLNENRTIEGPVQLFGDFFVPEPFDPFGPNDPNGPYPYGPNPYGPNDPNRPSPRFDPLGPDPLGPDPLGPARPNFDLFDGDTPSKNPYVPDPRGNHTNGNGSNNLTGFKYKPNRDFDLNNID